MINFFVFEYWEMTMSRFVRSTCYVSYSSVYLLSALLSFFSLAHGMIEENYANQSVAYVRNAFNKNLAWGLCISIDLHGCDSNLVQSKEAIRQFVIELCELIKMKRYGEPAIHWFGEGELAGYTMVQLIETSSITAHFTDEAVYLDLFSCKFYDPEAVLVFINKFFNAQKTIHKVWLRV